jgi:DNA-binding NarL/FixJ family response regulator
VVGLDHVVGEALAAALTRRGWRASWRHPEEFGPDPVPGVVVLDLLSGAEAVAELSTLVAGLGAERVVAVATMTSDCLALDGRADAWVAEDASLTDLAAAVEGAAPAARRPSRDAGSDRQVQLTSREQQILAQLLQGGGTVGMASRLGISERTVRVHLQNVLDKLGVHSRAEAAVWAIRAGIAPANAGNRASS